MFYEDTGPLSAGTRVELIPEVEYLGLEVSDLFCLDSPQLLLRNKPDVKGCLTGLAVKKMDQEIKRNLGLTDARRFNLRCQPSISLLVQMDLMNTLQEGGGQPHAACDPVPTNVLH